MPIGRVSRAAEHDGEPIVGGATPFVDPAREIHRARRRTRSGRMLGVDQHRRQQARLTAAIDPGVVGAALHDAVAGMKLDLAFFHHHSHRARDYHQIVDRVSLVHGWVLGRIRGAWFMRAAELAKGRPGVDLAAGSLGRDFNDAEDGSQTALDRDATGAAIGPSSHHWLPASRRSPRFR